MFPTHPIATSESASPLRVELRDPPPFTSGTGTTTTFDAFLENWPTTGLLVARKGTVLFERYRSFGLGTSPWSA